MILTEDRNPGVKTVEGCFEEALHEAGLISDDNFGSHMKINWGRASRTDKGVHAGMNGIQVKIQVLKKHLYDYVTEADIAQGKERLKHLIDKKKVYGLINSFLPDGVSVYALRLVQKKFVIKDQVDSRLYYYLIPLKVFHPLDHSDPTAWSKFLHS